LSRIVIETFHGKISRFVRFDWVGASACFIAVRLKG
jgi:hypothetical protein